MALGGFLAGLAQSSKQWPGAMQNRMLSQQQEEARRAEAERRTQEGVRQQQNAIIQRLGIAADAGSPTAVEGYGGQLNEINALLLPAFMQKAEDTREKINLNDEIKRFEFEQSKIEGERNKYTDWVSAGPGTLRRTNRDTGKVEYMEGVKPPPKNEQIFVEHGKILRSDGSTIEIDPELVALIKEQGSLENPVFAYDKEGGVMILKDGQQRKLDPEIQEYIDARLQKRADLKFKSFMEEQDYRLEHRIKYLNISTGLSRESDDLKYQRTLLTQQHNYAKDLYKTAISSLENKRSSPQAVLMNVTQAMESYGIPSDEIERYTDLWKPAFYQYKYNYSLPVDQRKYLGTGRAIQIASERIHQLLKDPEVRKRVGQLTGQIEDIKLRIKGGKGVPQSFIEFQTELDNLVDKVKRARTGAAATSSENQFYQDLLGSSARDWEYMQGKMAAIIAHENREAFSIHSTGWLLMHGKQLSQVEEAGLRADLLFQSDVMVSSSSVSAAQLKKLRGESP